MFSFRELDLLWMHAMARMCAILFTDGALIIQVLFMNLPSHRALDTWQSSLPMATCGFSTITEWNLLVGCAAILAAFGALLGLRMEGT
jgi:hypothetical protein